MPKITADFVNRQVGYGKIILQLLANRNLTDRQKIEQFFNLDYKRQLLDPSLFANMDEAIKLIIKHIKNKNKIVVYGDYDADGVTATALLYEILKTLKAKVSVYIPHRVSEGYGLNKKAVDELAQAKVKLIITVDTGIRNQAEVAYVKSAGLEVIITDHHTAPAGKDLPDCLIINPMMGDYPTKSLAGVGVGFKLAKGLLNRAKLTEENKKNLEESVLDLVAIGTVADCVSLLGENRVLVAEGLKIINRNTRLGLDELLKVAQIKTNGEKPINSWNIGWQIAPRLNSAGRLDHANTAFELLVTKNEYEAKQIAEKLNQANNKRQKLTDEIFAFCEKVINREILNEKILILVSPDGLGANNHWSEGVIGLVAGRLCDKYSRPAVVITQSGEEVKGSGRSIEEFNIIDALEQTRKYLSRFGGHARAGGFTLKSKKDLVNFSKEMKKIAERTLKQVDLSPKLMIEVELALSEVNDQLINDLSKFEPFGEDNPRPKFMSRNLPIRDKVIMGLNGQHIKFRVGNFWAVAFSQAEQWQELRIGDKVNMVYYLEFNQFNGRSEIQLKIVDIKTCNT